MRNPTAFLKEEYDDLVSKSLDWKIQHLNGPSTPHCIVNGKEVIMMTSNNYLNLANNSKVKRAAIAATKKWGAGAGAVPGISGNLRIQKEFEERLAKFKGVEAAVAFPTGFAVNSGLIPQLIGKGDLVISDELNHGSIIDGVRLSKAERAIYKHNDMADLERVLNEAENNQPVPRRILIITDGVFSMDGDIAPLPEIAKLAEEHGAMVYVDDCHGEGVLGEGRGIVHHFGLQGKVHVEGGCMGKGFGIIGGSCAGSQDLINFAYNKSRTWLLSTSPTPATFGAAIAAIDIMEKEPKHNKKLWRLTKYFKKRVDKLGFNTGNSQTPIIPIIVGEPVKAKTLSDELFKEGVWGFPIVFPMVAREKSRIRLQINAGLSTADLDFALDKLEKIGKNLEII
ncbi:aminotransferase class I/II-fold pyridoxal phosphate-dependent enzyme [Candidatus Micrarchaeota archaeon]|nr:aminotransferase class I/II-fold pyridoxal phosphate-dependent enzyme [Candidatus Micrarchaeota archaeon]